MQSVSLTFQSLLQSFIAVHRSGCCATQQSLIPLADRLAENDLAIAYSTYRIKALVAMLNDDITACVQQVAQQSKMRSAATHRELNSVILFIALFALLALGRAWQRAAQSRTAGCQSSGTDFPLI